MKNYLGESGTIKFTGTARTSGQIVKAGKRVGVVVDTVTSSDTGVAKTTGRYNYAKLTTDVITRGAKLYYDDTNDWLTLTKGSLNFAGWAVEDAGNGVTTVDFDLAGGSFDT